MSEQLSPVAEYLETTRKKLSSNPLSLSAPAYRETLANGPQMLANEQEFARACYIEGYKKAIEDLKEATSGKDNPKKTRKANKRPTKGAEVASVSE